jgi:hypothetical protein
LRVYPVKLGRIRQLMRNPGEMDYRTDIGETTGPCLDACVRIQIQGWPRKPVATEGDDCVSPCLEQGKQVMTDKSGSPREEKSTRSIATAAVITARLRVLLPIVDCPEPPVGSDPF